MNAANSIVYGRAAYEGFAKAIGSRLGLTVQIDNGARACINSNGTIFMPGMNTFQTPQQFAVTCGVIVHELAHQFYGSHRHIDPNRSRLEHDCLNAVLDVADETWVDEYFRRAGNGRPGELLTAANASACNENYNAFKEWNNAATHAWKVLCVGILGARLNERGVRHWKRYTAHHAGRLGVDAKACFRLLRSARLGKTQSPGPSRKRFRKLLQLAAKLAELLKPIAPPEGSAAQSLRPIEGAVAAGSTTQPAGTNLAGEGDGAQLASAPVANAAGGSGQPDNGRTFEYDADSFTMLHPSVQRIADRIATDGDGISHVDGLASGPILGQAHRLITDGQCLGRWADAEHADGVAVSVLLDCSGSMNHHLAECAGIARSFVVAMRNAGPVQALAFGSGVEESDDFSRVHLMGGTATDLAIKRAAKWLADKPGERWIIVITDGQPRDPIATDEACRVANAAKVRVLAVGLNCTIKMADATCVSADDPTHLAIELDAAARMIERG